MEKLSMKMKVIPIPTVWSIVMIMVLLPLAHGAPDWLADGNVDGLAPGKVDWFKELPHAKEKLTKLHFYYHDNATAKIPTVVQVAQANVTSKSPTMFGATFVLDDLLTLGPQPDSKIIGRAQGISSSVSQEEITLIRMQNLVFTDGEYNGSTLSLLGSDPVLHKYKELPIAGGTGVFRLARGIATAKTYTYNSTTSNFIVEFHVLVMHY